MDFMGFVIVSSILIPLIPTVVICIIYGLCEYISGGTVGGCFLWVHGVRRGSGDRRTSTESNSSSDGDAGNSCDCDCF